MAMKIAIRHPARSPEGPAKMLFQLMGGLPTVPYASEG